MSKAGSAAKVKLNSFDDLFGASDMTAGTNQVQEIPLSELYEFKGHPFKVLDDEKIFDLILETVLCKNKSIVVASSEYPAELVRSKFLKLNMFHVEYAMDCMRKNTSKIHNIKKYLLAALFNAPSTISGYYQAEVNHDLPQYVANDK